MTSNNTQGHSSLRATAILAGVCFGLWLLLTDSLATAELLAGLLVALAAIVLTNSQLAAFDCLKLGLGAVGHLLAYGVVFAIALLRANLDMARRILSPSLPIRPALVHVRTELQSDFAKLLLANSITLTPGTLSVDVQDDLILVHWIDVPPGIDIDAATRTIAASFERHIGGFLK